MKVNGADFEIESAITLKEYLEAQGYNVAKVAVEMNGDIVPKATFEQVVLSQDDVLEVVSFVGGG